MKNRRETTTQEQKSSREQVEQVAVVQPPESLNHEGLAKKFGVELKTVSLVREVVAEVLAAGDKGIKVTPEVEQLVEQAAGKRLQELVVIVRDLIEQATGLKLPLAGDAVKSQQLPAEESKPDTDDDWAEQLQERIDLLPSIAQSAAFAMLDVARKNPDLGEKMREKLWHHAQGPALMQDDDIPEGWWMSFWSELAKDDEAETTKTEESQEAAGKQRVKDVTCQSVLKLIKHWMAQRNYTEKLTAVLLWQLSNKCHIFEKPDNLYHDELFKQWEAEIIEASEDARALMNDNDGLEPDMQAELVAVSAVTATWIPMEV